MRYPSVECLVGESEDVVDWQLFWHSSMTPMLQHAFLLSHVRECDTVVVISVHCPIRYVNLIHTAAIR